MIKTKLVLAAMFAALVAVPLAAQSFSEHYTFLKAVRERDGTVAERILSNPSSTAVHARDAATGEGVLHILVRGRDLTWLSYMLSRGARPDSQANDGTTPLLMAAQIGWLEGADALLVRRANPNLGNRGGITPLMAAVQVRNLQMVRLLLQNRANPNQTDNQTGNSAIDYARLDPRAAMILRELEQPRGGAATTAPRPATPAPRPQAQ